MIRKTIAGMISMCMLFLVYAPLPVYAERVSNTSNALNETDENHYEYTVSSGQAVITAYTGNETEVVIPSELGGAPVKSIGRFAFENCTSITSVVIPDTVTTILENAFYGCKGLTKIHIPESVVSVRNRAFFQCESLTTAGPEGSGAAIEFAWDAVPAGAFQGDNRLVSVTLPDGQEEIGDWTFSDCYDLTEVNNTASVKTVGIYVFNKCQSLETIDLSSAVTIKENAFRLCTAMTGIALSNSLETVEESAFSRCRDDLTVDYNGTKSEFDQIQIGPDNEALTKNVQYQVQEVIPPVFKGHQLVLSGTLALKFGLVLPDGFDEENSYMTFTLNGEEQRIDTADAEEQNGRKIFICYLNTLQMAEEIEAVFHYGDNQEVSHNYSLLQYFDFFDEHAASYDARTIDMIHAVADYGYYSQPYLINLHHLEGQYAEMPLHYTDSYDYEAIKPEVAKYTFVKDIDHSAVSRTSYKLSLDSDTAVSVYMQVPAGTELSASAVFAGNTYYAEKQSSTVYTIKIPGIKASQLGNTITINGYSDGNFTLYVSALSYVRSVLSSDSYDAEAKDALCSLYKYYAAVRAFGS